MVFADWEFVENQAMVRGKALFDTDACLEWLQEHITLSEAQTGNLRFL